MAASISKKIVEAWQPASDVTAEGPWIAVVSGPVTSLGVQFHTPESPECEEMFGIGLRVSTSLPSVCVLSSKALHHDLLTVQPSVTQDTQPPQSSTEVITLERKAAQQI